MLGKNDLTWIGVVLVWAVGTAHNSAIKVMSFSTSKVLYMVFSWHRNVENLLSVKIASILACIISERRARDIFLCVDIFQATVLIWCTVVGFLRSVQSLLHMFNRCTETHNMGRPQFQWAFPFAPNRPNMRSTSMWFSWHAMYVGVAPSLWFSHVSTDVVKYAELMFVISLICICCVVIMAYRSCSFGYEQKILGRVVVGLQKLSAICVARVQSVVMTHVMLFMLSCLWHVLHNQCCTISVARVAWNLLLLVLHNPRCTFLSSAVLLIEFDCFQSSGPWCILWTLFRFLVGINFWNSLVFLMIFSSWFRWLVFRIVLDGFWRQYITTVWYLRERIHFIGVLEVSTSRWCLSVVAWFLFSVGSTDLLLQLGNSSLEAIFWVRGHVVASHHLLVRVVSVCLWHCGAVSCVGVYYHRWSCQCKKFLFARVTHLLKLLDAIFGCFRLAISFRHWTSFRWQLSQRCDRCLCAASIRWVVLVWVLMLLLVSGSLLQVWSSSIRIAETFATCCNDEF